MRQLLLVSWSCHGGIAELLSETGLKKRFLRRGVLLNSCWVPPSQPVMSRCPFVTFRKFANLQSSHEPTTETSTHWRDSQHLVYGYSSVLMCRYGNARQDLPL